MDLSDLSDPAIETGTHINRSTMGTKELGCLRDVKDSMLDEKGKAPKVPFCPCVAGSSYLTLTSSVLGQCRLRLDLGTKMRIRTLPIRIRTILIQTMTLIEVKLVIFPLLHCFLQHSRLH